MKKRAVYQVINEVKSAPTGVDWLMIMAARKTNHQQRCFQKPINKAVVPEVPPSKIPSVSRTLPSSTKFSVPVIVSL